MTDVLTLETQDATGYGRAISVPKDGRQTFLADGAITRGQTVYVSKAGYVKVGAAGKKALGIAETTAADLKPVTVIVGKGSRVIAQSAGAITAGTSLFVKADDNGKVVAVAASAVAVTAAEITTDTAADPAKIVAEYNAHLNAAIEENRDIFAIPLTTVDGADKEVEIILI